MHKFGNNVISYKCFLFPKREFLISVVFLILPQYKLGRGGSVEESRTPEQEVQGWNPTTAVYCSLSKTPKLPKSTGKYPGSGGSVPT